MPRPKIVERVERLLSIVPYVVRHPGVTLGELSRLFDVKEEALAQDLRVVLLTGVPPFGPGDYIEVTFEEDRVWIGMAEPLTRPVRLTPGEALALYLRGAAVVGSPGLVEAEALGTALEKLRVGLGDDLASLPVATAESARPSGPLDAIRRAAREHERLEIEHYSYARDEVTTRTIDPEQVFAQLGAWYVAAWDDRAADERLFRIDRIRGVRPTGERFEPRGLQGLGRDLYSPGEADIRARVRLRPAARWVAEYYHVEDAAEADGALEVTIPTGDLAWLSKLLLRLGADAEVSEPDELVARRRELAATTLGRYPEA